MSLFRLEIVFVLFMKANCLIIKASCWLLGGFQCQTQQVLRDSRRHQSSKDFGFVLLIHEVAMRSQQSAIIWFVCLELSDFSLWPWFWPEFKVKLSCWTFVASTEFGSRNAENILGFWFIMVRASLFERGDFIVCQQRNQLKWNAHAKGILVKSFSFEFLDEINFLCNELSDEIIQPAEAR